MNAFYKLQTYYRQAKTNKWFRYFTIFCRVSLALGFIPSGMVKVTGERFTALPSSHPLGQYFDALFQTGFYYTFIGASQLLTAALLLIPRTALLGSLAAFPIMLNICVLTYATRFEGTRITTLMLLACTYLLCWYADRLKFILLPDRDRPGNQKNPRPNKFPFAFFSVVVAVVALVIVVNQYLYNIRPGNSSAECQNGCPGNESPEACNDFCNCIYSEGKPLNICLERYEKALENARIPEKEISK